MDGRRIYLMRHGETLYQSEASEGALGNGALTERGSEQIAAAAFCPRLLIINYVSKYEAYVKTNGPRSSRLRPFCR